jgi:predicted ArsR family transcriptional regulator
MGHGLGQTQQRALVVVAQAESGISVRALATVLGVTERRCRTIVTSLDERGQVDVERGPDRALIVWDPELHRAALSAERRQAADQRYVAHLLAEIRLVRTGQHRCESCGGLVNRNGRTVAS